MSSEAQARTERQIGIVFAMYAALLEAERLLVAGGDELLSGRTKLIDTIRDALRKAEAQS